MTTPGRDIHGRVVMDVTADTAGLRTEIDTNLAKAFGVNVNVNFPTKPQLQAALDKKVGTGLKVFVDLNMPGKREMQARLDTLVGNGLKLSIAALELPAKAEIQAQLEKRAGKLKLFIDELDMPGRLEMQAQLDTKVGKGLKLKVNLDVKDTSLLPVIAKAKAAQQAITAFGDKELAKRETVRANSMVRREESDLSRASKLANDRIVIEDRRLARIDVLNEQHFNRINSNTSAAALRQEVIQTNLDARLTAQQDAFDKRRSFALEAFQRKLQSQASKPILQTVLISAEKLNASLTDFDRAVTRGLRTSLIAFGVWSAAVEVAVGAAAIAGIASFAKLEIAATRASTVVASQKYADEIRLQGEAISDFGDVAVAAQDRIIAKSKIVSLATIGFSPTEVTQGVQSLLQAGQSLDEALGNIGPAAKFAQVNQQELVESTDGLAASLAAAGLKTEDSALLLDKFSFAAQSALGDAGDFLEAFANRAGASFRSYGRGVNETLTLLQLLGNTGVLGREAGTQAFIVLRDIAKAAGRSPEAFEKYNIAIRDAENTTTPFSKTLVDLATNFQKVQKARGDVGVFQFGQELGLTQKSIGSLLQIIPQVAEQGQKGLDDFTRGLDRTGGNVERQVTQQRKTIAAQFDNLKDTFSVAFSVFGEAASSEVTRFFDLFAGTGGLIAQATPQLEKFGASFGKLVGRLADFVQTDSFAKGVATLVEAIQATLDGVSASLAAFSEAFRGTSEGLSTFEAFASAIKAFAQLSATVLPVVARALGNVINFLIENRDAFETFAKLTLGVFAARKAFTLLIRPVASVAMALLAAKASLIAFSAAETLGPVKAGLVMVATRMGIITAATTAATTATLALTAAQTAQAAQSVTSAGAASGANILGTLGSRPAKRGLFGANRVGEGLTAQRLEGVAELGSGAALSSTALQTRNAAAFDRIATSMDKVAGASLRAGGALKVVFSAVAKFAVVAGLVTIAVGAFKGFQDQLDDTLRRNPELRQSLEALGTTLRHVGKAAEFATKLLFGIGFALGGITADLLGFVFSIPRLIIVATKRLYDAAVNLGKNIGFGVAQGIKVSAIFARDAVADFGKQTIDDFKSFFMIKSPSQLMSDEIGKQLGAGIADGLAKSSELIGKQVRNLGLIIRRVDAAGAAGYALTRKELALLEAAQPGIERGLERQRTLVEGLNASLEKLRSTQIKGSEGFSDALFGNDQAQKKLQIERLDLVAAGAVEPSGDVTGDPRIAEIDKQLKDLSVTAERLNLTESLELDPLRRKLEKTFNPIAELSFDEIIKQFKDLSGTYAKESSTLANTEALQSKLNLSVEKATEKFQKLSEAADKAKQTTGNLGKALETTGDSFDYAGSMAEGAEAPIARIAKSAEKVSILNTNLERLLENAQGKGPGAARARAILGIGSAAEATSGLVDELLKKISPDQSPFAALINTSIKGQTKASEAEIKRLKKILEDAEDDTQGNLGNIIASLAGQREEDFGKSIDAKTQIQKIEKQIKDGDYSFELTPKLEQQAIATVEAQIGKLQETRKAIIALGLPKDQTATLVAAVNGQIVNLRKFIKQNPVEIGIKVSGSFLGAQGPETTTATIVRQRAVIEKAFSDPSTVASLTKAQRGLFDKVRANLGDFNPIVPQQQFDRGKVDAAITAAFSNATGASQAPKELVGNFAKYATDIVAGITEGVRVSNGQLVKAGIDLAAPMDAAYTDYWKIKSPSKRMQEYGGFLVMGLAAGIAVQTPLAQISASTAGKAIINSMRAGMQLATPALQDYSDQRGLDVAARLALGIPPAKASGVAVMNSFLEGMVSSSGIGVDGTSAMKKGTLAYYLNKTIPEWIKANKGPVSYDATILVPAGQAVMEGFGKGLKSGFGEIQGFVKDVGPSLSEFISDEAFSGRVATVMADIAVGKVPDVEALFGDLRPINVGAGEVINDASLQFLHRTLSIKDTQTMAESLARTFGTAGGVTTDRISGATTTAGNLSAHPFGLAADIGTGGPNPTPASLDLFAAITPLLGNIFRQIIHNGVGYTAGGGSFSDRNHDDHIHAEWYPGKGFDKYSGKIGAPPFTDIPGASTIVDQAINAAARKYDIELAVLAGLFRQESGFNPNVISSDGGYGLAQLTSAGLLQQVGFNRLDPFRNADVGAKYLKGFLRNNSVSDSVGLYNAGSKPFPASTVNSHIPKVMAYIEQFRKIFGTREFGGFRELGGPTDAGKAYVVGERGPEIHVPRRSGTVIPADQTSRIMGGGATYNDNRQITVTTGATDPNVIVDTMEARTKRDFTGVNFR